LKKLEDKYNLPEYRHESYKDHKHPVNFNLGIINGGDWASSVPSKCTMEVRVGYFPGIKPEQIRKEVEEVLKIAAEAKGLNYQVEFVGFQAEGCKLGSPEFFEALGKAHKAVHGSEVMFSPVTCTTDARFFQLYRHIPTTCYGPEAKNIHGYESGEGGFEELQVIEADFGAQSGRVGQFGEYF